MSSMAMPQPGQGDPNQDPQQANPLQDILSKLIMASRQLGVQNVIIQPEMQQVSSILVSALQKVSQATSGPPQQSAAPQQQ